MPIPPRAAALHTILVGGGLAGLLDIAYALTVAWLGGGQPIRVLQAIASGVLGRDAFAGGVVTAALGLSLHFVIACGAAATFLAASRGGGRGCSEGRWSRRRSSVCASGP